MARIEKHTRKVNYDNNVVSNISKWKSSIMEKMIMDDELSKLLKYNRPDALSMRSLTEDEKYDLINHNIYGYRYIMEVADEAKSYVTLGISRFMPQEGYRQFSDDFMMGYIFFYVLVDNSLFDTENGYRQDLIADRIYNIFQSSKEFGIGELRLESFVENWEHRNKYGGYTMGFRLVDFK